MSMLRHRAERRTVAYLVFAAALLITNWQLGRIHLVLYPLSLFMGVAVAVISHNHNHLSMWRSRWMNQLTNYVIAIFYGYPSIGWIPTHNQIHHKLNNKPGDSSRSPKLFRKNSLLALLVYPTLTGIAQSRDIGQYLRSLRGRTFWLAISEYVVFLAFMVGVFLLDWRKALLFIVIPQQFALFTIQVFNYVQHVETDENSAWNHSRNFVSPLLNALLFNNGYHTVHHMKPGVHWTETPKLHAEHASKIHPALLVESWWAFMFWMFILRPFVPSAWVPAWARPIEREPELILTGKEQLEH